jgi:hypothetical protein
MRARECAARTSVRLDIRQPDVIRPAVGADLDVVATFVIAAIDQHMAHAGRAQFAECDLLRVGRHGGPPKGIILKLAPARCCAVTSACSQWCCRIAPILAHGSGCAVRCASVAALIDKFDAAGISVPPHHTAMHCRFEAIQ